MTYQAGTDSACLFGSALNNHNRDTGGFDHDTEASWNSPRAFGGDADIGGGASAGGPTVGGATRHRNVRQFLPDKYRGYALATGVR